MAKRKWIYIVGYIIIGLFYFFEPFLSSWFEIVNPYIARTIFLPIDWCIFIVTLPLSEISKDIGFYFPDILFGLITLVYLVFFFRNIQMEFTNKQKRLAFMPLVIFPLILGLLSPLGLSFYGEKRVTSYLIGGWSRMMFAGGPEILNAEGKSLLENSIQENPSDHEIPPAIEKLGGWVKIDQDSKSLLVGVGRLFNMADEFGYILQDESGSFLVPHYLERAEFLRVWKIAEGIYFFER